MNMAANTNSKTRSEQELIDEYGVWGEHPAYPVDDWQAEVENDETRQGYWEWVEYLLDLSD